MITEDYISFETAKLLKEKGFDETCRAFWKVWDNHTTICDCSPSHLFEYCHNSMLEQYNDDEETNTTAPTLQMAMKWLREAHNWTIYISPYWPEGDMRNKLTWYYDIESLIDNRSFRKSSHTDNYEEACEAAIKYCLENLI